MEGKVLKKILFLEFLLSFSFLTSWNEAKTAIWRAMTKLKFGCYRLFWRFFLFVVPKLQSFEKKGAHKWWQPVGPNSTQPVGHIYIIWNNIGLIIFCSICHFDCFWFGNRFNGENHVNGGNHFKCPLPCLGTLNVLFCVRNREWSRCKIVGGGNLAAVTH